MNRTVTDLGLLLGVFAGVTAIAAALGAANFGTALTFGEIAFAAALVWTIVATDRDGGRDSIEGMRAGLKRFELTGEVPSGFIAPDFELHQSSSIVDTAGSFAARTRFRSPSTS